MRIEPRQQLLEIWQALARSSFPKGTWEWGQWGTKSSVADAERLLCLLYPATEIPAFRLDTPDETADDVLDVLKSLGGRLDIPQRLLSILAEFTRVHTAEDGTPKFSGGYYFNPVDSDTKLTDEQRELGVVDSYSMAVTLSLATLGFLKVFLRSPRRQEIMDLAKELETKTQKRLTAAMISLLRSFSVNTFDIESPRGQNLLALVNQDHAPTRVVVQNLQRRLKPLRSSIGDSFVLGVDVRKELANENLMFECGWSWGLVDGAPEVPTRATAGKQYEGVAADVPYLYFTVVALDGIADLFSERTLTLGLLDEEQQRLSEALRMRWEITQQYWSTIARFGEGGSWPLEDIPWPATGPQTESEYYSLSVAAILVQDLVRRRATDDDLTRTVAVMEELAVRGRITRRMTPGDPAVALHNPGVRLPLLGTEKLGPPLEWRMSDFSAQLFKRTVQLATFSKNIDAYDRLIRLAESLLEHLWRRRVSGGRGTRLWDNIRAVYPHSPDTSAQPVSWSMTERMAESMVAATHLYEQPPIRSRELSNFATALLIEAGHLFGAELMHAKGEEDSRRELALKAVDISLRRARRVVAEQPGTACALAMEALGALDSLTRARDAGAKGG
ncbi:SCO2524 family protein [Streptomyces sp. NPDC048442]|uniref:SCO2524 family protein n=1 Tax=Streptomyces sp. NPDC048442 TaxID=3154823 RepID=UPI0034415E53